MVERILVVDDNEEICQNVAQILKDEGYSVDDTSDSGQGAMLISKNTYDVLLFDYKMAGLNGIDLLKIVKEKDAQNVVFIMSGVPFIERLLEKENVSHLVGGVLNKPFDMEILLQKIKTVI